MPSKKITAADLRQAVTAAKGLPTNKQGRSIKLNVMQSLDRVKSVPATVGTGLCNQKGNL
jgi:hypothetical protein